MRNPEPAIQSREPSALWPIVGVLGLCCSAACTYQEVLPPPDEEAGAVQQDTSPVAGPGAVEATPGQDDGPPAASLPADAGGDQPPPGPADPCAGSADAARLVFVNYCSGCHADGSAQGGFGAVLNVPVLIETGRVVAGDPESSPVFVRPSNGAMPPAGVEPRPGDDDLWDVENWILCGAPDWDAAAPPAPAPSDELPFMDFDTKVRLLHTDVRSIDNPIDRERVRYLDLSPLANAGMGDGELEAYRQALSLQLNSLSTSLRVTRPRAVDDARTLFRIDLEDYGWDENTWDRIVSEYPFAVRYDEDSRLFGYDEQTVERLRDEQQTDIPFVHADWFLATVSQAPLYYDILGIPERLDDLAADLGIDLVQNLEDERLIRAGIASSSVALNRNRVDERHDLPANQGAFWITFDFRGNLEQQSIFAFPLDFEHDASEAIHNLPNGLQAYSIWDANGNRLNAAERDLATTPHDPLGELSVQECSVCHGGTGMVPVVDAMHEFVLNNFAGGAAKEAVLAVYPGQEVIDRALEEDGERFAAAATRAGVVLDMGTGTNTVLRGYESAVTLARAAAYLEVTPEDLAAALGADPNAFPADIAALRNRGGTVQLDSFLAGFEATVEGLGLGEPISVQFVRELTN